jgi:hypothetical protein
MTDQVEAVTDIIETAILDTGHRLGQPVGADRLAEQVVEALTHSAISPTRWRLRLLMRWPPRSAARSPLGSTVPETSRRS